MELNENPNYARCLEDIDRLNKRVDEKIQEMRKFNDWLLEVLKGNHIPLKEYMEGKQNGQFGTVQQS